MSSSCGDGDEREAERTYAWSVFDGVKYFPPTPEALMADIDAAVASFEYARAASLAVHLAFPSSQGEAAEKILDERDQPAVAAPVYDKHVGDEAYKAACSALASGKVGDAIRSLHLALASCPPDKTSSLAKLRSLLDIASWQQQPR